MPVLYVNRSFYIPSKDLARSFGMRVTEAPPWACKALVEEGHRDVREHRYKISAHLRDKCCLSSLFPTQEERLPDDHTIDATPGNERCHMGDKFGNRRMGNGIERKDNLRCGVIHCEPCVAFADIKGEQTHRHPTSFATMDFFLAAFFQ